MTKKLTLVLCDNHLTFWFTAGFSLAENTLNFSAIDITKATLRLKFTGAGTGLGPISFKIELYNQEKAKWETLREIVQDWCLHRWCADKEQEFDVTLECQSNSKFRYRPTILLGNWVLYYSCMHVVATLTLEYTTGTVEGEGYTGTFYAGDMNLQPIAQVMSLVMSMTIMTLIFNVLSVVMEETV